MFVFNFFFFFFQGRQVFPQLNKKNCEAKQKLKPFPPLRKVLAVLHCITFMHHLNINYCLLLVLTYLKARASGGSQRKEREEVPGCGARAERKKLPLWEDIKYPQLLPPPLLLFFSITTKITQEIRKFYQANFRMYFRSRYFLRR